MNHNYRLEDLNLRTEIDTDINDIIVSLSIGQTKSIPATLKKRIESVVNNMISDYEENHIREIPAENIVTWCYMSMNTQTAEFSVKLYGVCPATDEELFDGDFVISAADKDYRVAKEYYGKALNDYLNSAAQRIMSCVA